MSGWETHTVSRSTSIEQRDSRIQRDHVERGWERWKNTKLEKHKADEKREREGGFMHPFSRKMREFQRAGKGKRKERECVMYTHAFAYVCACIYIYIYLCA